MIKETAHVMLSEVLEQDTLCHVQVCFLLQIPKLYFFSICRISDHLTNPASCLEYLVVTVPPKSDAICCHLLIRYTTISFTSDENGGQKTIPVLPWHFANTPIYHPPSLLKSHCSLSLVLWQYVPSQLYQPFKATAKIIEYLNNV